MEYEILVFGAHPDDAEMGMGGTVAALAAAGHAVHLVSMTRGECGTYGSPAEREAEAAAAAAILGCTHELLDFPDTRVVADVEARERILRLLRATRPRIVFAPYHTNALGHHDGAGHVDHLATGVIVRDAVKLARLRGKLPELPAHDVGRLYYYMVPRNESPDLVVDVTPHYDTLVRAIRAHRSQMAIERNGSRILEILEAYRRFYGVLAGGRYAEAFRFEGLLRPAPEQLLEL